MASPEVLNVARLLAPIAGDSPAGPDLRADPSAVSLYHNIRGARKAASDAERRLDQGDDSGGPADWRKVLNLCAEALGEKSKDLEVAAYLVEAAVRTHGFAGLRDGFKVARGLVETFWEGLHPGEEEEPDVETRFSHVLWLSGIDKPGTLIAPVRKTPFTAPGAGAGPFSLTQYHQQVTLSQSQVADANLRKKKVAEGAELLASIQQAVAETPPKFYADLMDDAAAGEAEFRAFCRALTERTGYEPTDTDLIAVLEAYRDVVRALAGGKLPKAAAAAPPPAAAPEADAAPGAATATAAPAVDPAVIRDRADALDRLEKVAAYFREHEPQSVLPYALEQVVYWGRMPLPELLAELIPDDAPRKNLFKQLGIKGADAKK